MIEDNHNINFRSTKTTSYLEMLQTVASSRQANPQEGTPPTSPSHTPIKMCPDRQYEITLCSKSIVSQQKAVPEHMKPLLKKADAVRSIVAIIIVAALLHSTWTYQPNSSFVESQVRWISLRIRDAGVHTVVMASVPTTTWSLLQHTRGEFGVAQPLIASNDRSLAAIVAEHVPEILRGHSLGPTFLSGTTLRAPSSALVEAASANRKDLILIEVGDISVATPVVTNGAMGDGTFRVKGPNSPSPIRHDGGGGAGYGTPATLVDSKEEKAAHYPPSPPKVRVARAFDHWKNQVIINFKILLRIHHVAIQVCVCV
jgi:hypothetical protein